MSGANAACRPMSTAGIRGWTMHRRALASLACSSVGLDSAIGHVLPIARDATGTHWQTGAWFLRRERCYLLPGDSPMGMRLPLDSLPWAAPADRPQLHAPDPNQAFAPLPGYAKIRQRLGKATPGSRIRERHGRHAATSRHTGSHEPRSARSLVTGCSTSSCRRPLISRIISSSSPQSKPPLIHCRNRSSSRATSRRAIRVCDNFRVTPDPGVIEVNIHPAACWDELVDRTTHLYGAARLSRLTSEKFMLDGRHTGTGGGNHFVLGGATTADSPFLRRPDLLRSLLAYWHNHPALSYLFSGLFIGPTSQAPRLDEARNDSLNELEIAFRQLPPPGAECAPWLVDRLFRNLLIDVTGNTHRAEFCIDKLYSPDGPTGRLGLLELRAFEMPPHERMSLTQQLLLRSLVARFWRTPYSPAHLVRWGTELHDRFMLPHFIAQDFADVIAEQNAAGYALRAEWFAPHVEFRFPKLR